MTIYKLLPHSAIDFAAEELKKYLRMMMPEAGDIKISYDPRAKDGFRLGLMQDLGLDVSDAEDPELDDILYIKCDTGGGIIAGSNPRSVLLAVYEYLRQNGCRWLMPGVDGELIPMQDIVPVNYRHKPSMRYRGWCNEGAEFQECMLDAIDFAPKVGLNIFMLEAHIPMGYYRNYYDHPNNSRHRHPEPVSHNTVLQWKRQCETEIAKRGLQFHDIGHGWTAFPFGIDIKADYNTEREDSVYGDGMLEYIAYADGKRGVFRGNFMNTNYCMSNPTARKLVTDSVVAHAKKHTNADYIHVWLSDGMNNHCECENCKKKTPSDWYMIQLNEIDETLTNEGLDSKIVFIAYLDTIWAPTTEHIKNEKRFTLLTAPISRSYSETLPKNYTLTPPLPYKRNQNVQPKHLGEFLGHIEEWKKFWHGSNVCYEYHFWRPQYYDVSGIELARVINEDVRFYKSVGMDGIIEDGSQRSFFPTGLVFYTYARTLFNSTLTADEIRKEYMNAAFGDGAEEIYGYLSELSDAFSMPYVMGKKSENTEISPYYAPGRVEFFDKVPDILARADEIIKRYYNSDERVRTVSTRLLEYHTKYAEIYARALKCKAVGNDKGAREYYAELIDKMGALEDKIERYYDFNLSVIAMRLIFENISHLPEAVFSNDV